MRSFRREDVVGKTVIETSGAVKGKVRDVMFDLGGGVTLLVQGADGKDSQIPLSMVTGISEHVVVKVEVPQSRAHPVMGQLAGSAEHRCLSRSVGARAAGGPKRSNRPPLGEGREDRWQSR